MKKFKIVTLLLICSLLYMNSYSDTPIYRSGSLASETWTHWNTGGLPDYEISGTSSLGATETITMNSGCIVLISGGSLTISGTFNIGTNCKLTLSAVPGNITVYGTLNISQGDSLKFGGMWGSDCTDYWFYDGCYINVVGDGIINATGTSGARIVFTATNHENGWGGINFYNATSQNNSILKYCDIEYGNKYAPITPGCRSWTYDFNGGAINAYNYNYIVIENCSLRYNYAGLDGGAIYCSYSDITIGGNVSKKNVFICDTASRNGGAIYCENSNITIIGNDFVTNNAINGGGIELYNSSADISLNRIRSNTTDSNGAGIILNQTIENNSEYVSIINNLIIKNTASDNGGGIMLMGYPPDDILIHSNTIADNVASDGGGIYGGYGNGSYVNNIIWENTPNSANNILSNYPTNDYVNFSYCDIDGFSGSSNNNISSDPSFNSPGSNDYRVHASTNPNPPYWTISPCLDIGDNNVLHTTYDLSGTFSRITNDTIDIGAFENDINAPHPYILIPDTLLTIKTKTNIPFALKLQLYPNPVVSEVLIKFELAEKSNIKIEIYDIYGKTMASVTDKSFMPGIQQVNWKIRNIPQGMYLCKLFINNDLTAINKFIIE